ncbi:Fe(3+)-hydroxamate ABC transporter permease FhuB [Escherichia albertii]|uniref:Fe(3+)-hydroxamate ABC transporter permease FhuB n=3 Tax=Escherichia albertii TaxID=208962 RepID=UPI00292D087B|nr:Fe(3+)-hydroxamate ABC transporter permease FhuB [Escherichia albertii]WOA25776.1 Fe(3+)-hydroxamate ABC transporter permease FhuB [Escherichia albertii]
MSRRIALFPALLLAILVITAAALTWVNFSQALPRSQWAQAIWSPDIDAIEQMIFHYSLLPRLAISLLVGAGLGLVGVLFQQVLRNPLAEPTTLGVATGAQLGITVTTLWAIPGAMASQFAALAGACVVGLIVFGVAWGKRLSPVTLILAGLVVSLYCGAINQLLVIFHHDQLQSMFLWSTGTLTQTDWGGVERLWPQLLGGVMLTLLLLRPLTLMGLDDGVARNLGLALSLARLAALSLARLAALSLAIVISALLVNAVGIIGFIGLFAPLLAKMLGARRLLPRLMLASLIGALILWLSDQIILWLTRVWMEVSTGSVTALIGAPLLLWLLPRLRSISAPDMKVNDRVATERQHVLAFALAGGVLLLIAVVVALSFGRDSQGWTWASGALLEDLMPWRWPRIMAALFAGVMLAVAGCIIQRLTGNPMASPEVLGISSGAAFGVVLMLFLVPGNAFGWLLPAGSLGAAVTLLIIMIAAGRGGFSPHRMLLAGMALSTAFTMLLMMLQASGDPRMAQVLTWISGSTYNATDAQVWRTGIVMVILLAITPLCRRWLTILPLGGDTARAVGMALTPTRVALLLLAASLTATATMTIGPLSFVGLMAPHIARMMGFRRTMPHIVISALVGGGLLVFADWCGRMVLFPFQVPAGLLSTFIGAPYFIYLLRKQSR